MDPFGNKGTFFSYSETSKDYRIYVSSQWQIAASKDVNFDEDLAFQRSRESHIDIDMEEHEAPWDSKIPVLDAPCLDIQREKYDVVDDPIDPIHLVELVEPSERPRDGSPTKRRLAWLLETL